MESTMNVQELVDGCLSFLDSPADLKSCALVSRSWAYAAQAHLFRRVSFSMSTACTNEQRWHLLGVSKHLLLHIQHLYLEADSLSPATFAAICVSPLARLKQASVILHTRGLDSVAATAIQELVSLRTLRRLIFRCSFADPALFLLIWARCSPSIRHLDLAATSMSAGDSNAVAMEPVHEHANRVPITTLAITASVHGVNDWLMHDFSPFDCSALRVLSIAGHPKLTGWVDTAFPPSIRNIEVFDFVAWGTPPVITLSALPCLRVLRIHLRGFPPALPILATLGPTSAVRKIVLTMHFPLDKRLRDVDRRLCALPVRPLPIIELETAVDERHWERARRACFPGMDARGLLRRVDPPKDWLSECILTLGDSQ